MGDALDKELEEINLKAQGDNKQLQLLAELIDKNIYKNYKLWPSNYIAYDLLNNSNVFNEKYTEREKRQFERRIERRVTRDNKVALKNFLAMYANPVKNNIKYFDK